MIRTYNTIHNYLSDTLSFLVSCPVKNNIVIGQCLAIKERDKILNTVLLINIYREGIIVLSAFKNHPNFVLYGDNYSGDDLLALSQEIKTIGVDLYGVIGSSNLVENFSKIFTPIYRISKKLLAQQLGTLKKVELSEGNLEECSIADLDLLFEWMENFNSECELQHAPSGGRLKEMIKSKIDTESIYKWVDRGQIMSICAEVSSNDYFSKISWVYTSSEHRRKNYARSAVWSLTKLIQDRGQKTICLFTDKSNPTSNKIYSEIGYEMVHEDYEISFDKLGS